MGGLDAGSAPDEPVHPPLEPNPLRFPPRFPASLSVGVALLAGVSHGRQPRSLTLSPRPPPLPLGLPLQPTTRGGGWGSGAHKAARPGIALAFHLPSRDATMRGLPPVRRCVAETVGSACSSVVVAASLPTMNPPQSCGSYCRRLWLIALGGPVSSIYRGTSLGLTLLTPVACFDR